MGEEPSSRFSASIQPVRQALLEILQREWPDPVDLTPRALAQREVRDEDFIKAALQLQEEGLIMYEALLIGTEPQPRLFGAMLTRRGQIGGLGPAA